MSANSGREAPYRATRRYVFYADSFVTCELIWLNGQWHVEKEGGGNRVRLSLTEFERTDTGKKLGQQLEAALREAELDV